VRRRRPSTAARLTSSAIVIRSTASSPFEDAQTAADRLRANGAVVKIVLEMPHADPEEGDR